MTDTTAKPGELFEQRYELLEILGAGGIGTVFKAKQLDGERFIALKILHSNFADDEEFTARFKREGQALSRLHHENIVTVYHLGLSSADVPYLAMELIRGTSIRKHLNEHGAMPLTIVLNVAMQICSALKYMHSEGVIHRDLKPDNIVFVDGLEQNQIKIIDFGLVKIATASDVQKLTSTGTLIGSVAYMSPEQCKGQKADPRSDLYSLVICIFEMFTGKAPYASENPMEIMYKQVNATVPLAPPMASPKQNKAINDFFQKGLQKDPDKRFQNAAEMEEELNSLIELARDSAQKSESRSQNTIPKQLLLIPLSVALLVVSAVSIVKFANFSKEKASAVRSVIPKDSPKEAIQKILDDKETTDTYKIQSLLIFFKQHGVNDNKDLIKTMLEIFRRMPMERKKSLYPKAMYQVGYACYEATRYKVAKPLLEDVVRMTKPYTPQEWITDDLEKDAYWQSLGFLCQIYLREGRPQDALKAARIIAECPYGGDADALTVALSCDDEKLARDLIKNQKSNGHLASLSRVCRMFKRYDLAKICLQQLSGEMGDVKFQAYLLERAKLMYQTGQISEARNIMKPFGVDNKEMSDFYSNAKKGQFRCDAAMTFERLGEHDKAVMIMSKNSYRSDTNLLFHAYLCCEDGDFDKAEIFLAEPSVLDEFGVLRDMAKRKLTELKKSSSNPAESKSAGNNSAGNNSGAKLFELDLLPY